jgi:hypothetical protein
MRYSRRILMARTRVRTPLLVSVCLHAVALLALGLYVLVEKEIISNPFAAELVVPAEPPKPRVRKPVARRRPIPKPTVAQERVSPVVSGGGPSRRVVTGRIKTANVTAASVADVADKAVGTRPPRVAGVGVAALRPAVSVPRVTTVANLPVNDTPDALAFRAPIGGGGGRRGRGGAGALARQVGVGQDAAAFSAALAGLGASGISLLDHVGVALDGMSDMPYTATIGTPDVIPLIKGEPGGRAVGRGREIRGAIRFVRLKHGLADWWMNGSALRGLTKWLNRNTQIRADMHTAGGAIDIADPGWIKSPIVWMTGHDPVVTQSRTGLLGVTGGSSTRGKFTATERQNIRQYLTQQQGMFVFDDCGLGFGGRNALWETVAAELRQVAPEYPILPIPNDHEIYSNFYAIGGPPVGFDVEWVAWWGVAGLYRPRHFLEGISVGENLVAILSRKDYMCSMKTVTWTSAAYLPSGVPAAYRWATNVVVYALTHGNISDYRDYVPENLLADVEASDKAPTSARVPTTAIPSLE